MANRRCGRGRPRSQAGGTPVSNKNKQEKKMASEVITAFSQIELINVIKNKS
jgi:hypothetical protein